MFAGFALVLAPAASHWAGAASVPADHLTMTGSMSGWRLASWWLIAVWTIVDPSFHQRCAAAESPETARRGIFIAIGFWFCFDLMTTAAGLLSRSILPELDRPLMAFPALAERVLPAGLRGLFYAGLASSIVAALQTTSLVAGLSLGKDALGRKLELDEGGLESAGRFGLALALFLGWALALWLPSVVELWYAVGSAVIPALLLPMLGAYFERWRAPGRWALASSACGLALSASWWLAGRARGAPPLGLEPMFPGLLASFIVWFFGLRARAQA
jgi:solute:Na+ symporter, SSS family